MAKPCTVRQQQGVTCFLALYSSTATPGRSASCPETWMERLVCPGGSHVLRVHGGLVDEAIHAAQDTPCERDMEQPWELFWSPLAHGSCGPRCGTASPDIVPSQPAPGLGTERSMLSHTGPWALFCSGSSHQLLSNLPLCCGPGRALS